jgi:hypothetical protein
VSKVKVSKSLTAIIILLSASLFSGKPTLASEATGRIEKIENISDGRFIVFIQGAANRPNKPSCVNPVGYFVVANENSQKGKKQIMMLRFAKKNNLVVEIAGTGSCRRWIDAENINYLAIQE